VPSQNVMVLYGTTKPRPCKLCGKTETRFGTLVDPNGHSWLVCVTCIDNLWKGNAAIIQDAEVEERARQLVQDKLFGLSDD
jgi:hypothetical protein